VNYGLLHLQRICSGISSPGCRAGELQIATSVAVTAPSSGRYRRPFIYGLSRATTRY